MGQRIPIAVRAAAGIALLGALLVGCATAPAESPGPTAIAAATQGRSRCPGSAPVALTNLQGAAADTVERLQSTYEAKPGFLAVVFDGAKATVVVEAARLPEWLAELTPKGIAVAPSCVDPILLAAVKAALPGLAPDGMVSAGYNGLDDAIEVVGTGEDALLPALDLQQAGMGDQARAAVAAGTLRINGDKISGTR
jgi:hypothetical protein